MKRARIPRSGALSLEQAWRLRAPERELLLWCLGALGLGHLMILGSAGAAGRLVGWSDWLPLLIHALALAVIHATLVMARFRGDQLLVVALAWLSGVGLLTQYRMGALDPGDLGDPGLYAFPLGVILMLVCALGLRGGRLARLAEAEWIWAALSIALVGALLLLGQRFRGAVYGVGLITPTEVLKISLVLFLAAFIERRARPLAKWSPGRVPLPPWRALRGLGLVVALLGGLLLVQRDLGMLAILGVTLLVMLVAGTGRSGYAWLGLAGAAFMALPLLALFAHGQRRIAAWLSPFEDPTGASWQILQGLSGMYAGGLWGQGFGQGQPHYTPIAQSDFIYAVIGEELGFIGALLLCLFYLLLLARGLAIAERTRALFPRLVALGLTTVLACQILLNLGGVTKLIPLTGITLPFISQGGSSLVTGFVALGLLLAISDGVPPKPRRARTPAPDAGAAPDTASASPRRSRKSAAQTPDAEPARPEAAPTPGADSSQTQ